MSAAPAWSIIVPTLNERESILVLLRAIEAQAASWPDCEVVVVDDRSADGTAALVREASFAMPVRVIERDPDRGLAGAVLRGAREARAGTVVVMDADLSHPPAAIASLAGPVAAGVRDIVIGSRHVAGGGSPGWPWRRRLMSRCAAWLAAPFTHVRDPMSGFFAARRSDLLAVGEGAAGYKILLELLARHADPERVAEVPIRFEDRRYGSSKLGLGTIRDYLRRLAVLAGCNLSARSGAGFALVGLSGVVVDLAAFALCRQAGAGLAVAHIAGFLAATASNFALNARFAFAARPGAAAYLRFIVVALMALALRGGVLSACQALGVPELPAVIMGIAAGAAVNLIGIGFWVFPLPDADRAGRWRLAAIAVMAYLVALRLAYAGQTELLAEEAYYWSYAQHLDIGYLDHPPMVAWLIAAATAIGGDNAFAVRAPALLCWLVALASLCRLATLMWGRDAGWMTALAVCAMPFAMGVGLVMTPDAPLTAAWSFLLLAVWQAMRSPGWAWWLAAGLALGVGLLSKYSIALLVPAVGVYLLASASGRRQLGRPGPWLALLVAGACFAPVVVWNGMHDWVSFRFQGLGRWSGAAAFHGHELLRDLLALAGPVALAAVAIGWRHALAVLRTPAGAYLGLAILAPLAVFALHALRHEPRPNWTGPALLALLPLVGACMAWELRRRGGRWRGRLLGAAILLPALLLGGFLHYLAVGMPGVPYPRQVARFIGWHRLGEEVRAMVMAEAEQGRAVVVAGVDRYNIASQVAFAYPARGEARPLIASGGLFGRDDLMFGMWTPAGSVRGRDVVLVGRDARELEAVAVAGHFARLEPVRDLPIRAPDGTVVASYALRIGRCYRP